MPAGFGSLGIDAAYAMLLNVIYLTAAISAGKKGQHWLQALGLWSCCIRLVSAWRHLPLSRVHGL